ncbi:MAG: TonB-dependent receptor [Acidithiobacillus sp.]|nr:TonB-dependent receptor [Acidithiobacillus sp.]
MYKGSVKSSIVVSACSVLWVIGAHADEAVSPQVNAQRQYVLQTASTSGGESTTVTLEPVTVTGSHGYGSTIPLDEPAQTGSRLGITIKETPASIEVINQDTMRERGDRTVVDAVEKSTGFSAGVTPATPGMFSVRGFHTNGVTWLYNGTRIPGGSSMSSRMMDTSNLDRIEVLRGPASVLSGEGGIGGTINLITKGASFAKQPIEVDYAMSSFDSHRFHMGTGGAIKDELAAYRFDVSTNRYGSNVEGERAILDRLTGSVLFKLSDTLSLVLELDKMRDDTNNAYYGTPLVNGKLDSSLRRVNYNNLSDNKNESDTTWVRANVEWLPGANVEIRNQLYYYDSFRDWRDVEAFSYKAGAVPSVTRAWWGELDHDHKMLGNRVDGLFKGQIGNMANRFLIGLDVNKTTFKTKRNGFPGSQVVDAYNPPSVSFWDVTNVAKALAREVDIDQLSVFAENQLALTNKLKLVAGLRLDHMNVDWVYHDSAGSPRESKSHAFNSWRMGAVYDLTPDSTFYASYATGVEPGGTLFLLNRNQSQLDLTTARQVEVGLKQLIMGGKGEWTAAIYDIEKNNVFVPDPANPSSRLPVGKQSSQGVELSLGLRPSSQWQFDGNLAYVRARYDEYSTGNPPVSWNGNVPPFVPQWVANFGVRYMPTAVLSFGSWIRHVDEVYIDDVNKMTLPSYTTLDLSVDYAYSKDLDVGFRVRNVTDELYATWVYAGSQAIIGNPRSYELVLRMRF